MVQSDDFDQSFDLDELERSILDSLEERQKLVLEGKNPFEEVYIIPLLRRPSFPGMAAPITIEPGPFYEIIKKIAKSEQKLLGLFLTFSEEANVYKVGFEDLFPVGVLARVLRIIPMEQGGGAQVILNIEERVIIANHCSDNLGLKAEVLIQQEESESNTELKAYAITIISPIKELLKLNPLFKEELQIFLSHSDFTEPGKLADFAVALTTASREELQEILATFDVKKRIEKALLLLKKELDISLLQNNINQKIEATINKTQKDYFLREQLKTIKKELGLEREDKSSDRDKFEARLKNKIVPPEVLKVIQEELDKLISLEIQSAEYGVVRGYLDWLTILPWGIHSEDSHSISQAEKILEEDHYGLEDIKERILEFIGVGKLTGRVKGSILCFVGPPGVGKTSIGKSIARALNRKFYRFSVGGMRDEAEIKGHRRTYIGAMPGKLIQALKFCQTMNPVIMLDEVDKMSKGFHGDPGAALLEVLDPEQNNEFLDHYLDVRFDLSNVLFIMTANVLDAIPDALKDRMDVMRLSGYIMEEKIQIAKKFLIPRHRKEMGLKATDVSFGVESLRALINGYAREAGVRTLEGLIKKILRKLALKLAREFEEQQEKKRGRPKKIEKKTLKLDIDNLSNYLGKPLFTTDRFYDHTPVGVSMGLAWTSLGGATLYVETVKIVAEKAGMKLTGQAGEVMKESAEIAWSYLHGAIQKYAPKFTFFEKTQVHMHIPEGATPKDGPSAGVTMVTALLSLLIDTPVLENLGMTGELTLTGRVLGIGGVKEKIVAARRSGLKILIFPSHNRRDFDELPPYLKKGVVFHFVDHYDEIFKIAFPQKILEKELSL